MTFTRDQKAVDAITRVMLESHEALVDYMTPLGLHHIMWGGHHYGPAPWWDKEKRDDWNPTYYHRADERGLGFDRTKTGSHSVSQYHPPVRDSFANLSNVSGKVSSLVPSRPVGSSVMRSGRTLWDELALHYQRGVDWMRTARKEWDALAGAIDPERHAEVAKKLEIQERDAVCGATPACSTFRPSLSVLCRRAWRSRKKLVGEAFR